MLFLFELEAGQNMVEKFDKSLEKDEKDEEGNVIKPRRLWYAKPLVQHEISMRQYLTGGKKYVIVPAPRKAKSTGKYFLSIYFDTHLYKTDVRRLNGPNPAYEQYEFIMEEYEKQHRRVPNWKVDLVRESIPHVIG